MWPGYTTVYFTLGPLSACADEGVGERRKEGRKGTPDLQMRDKNSPLRRDLELAGHHARTRPLGEYLLV